MLLAYPSGNYIWSDQSEMEYLQWGPGEPAERLAKQTDVCGFLNFDRELSPQYGANWTADRCSGTKGWICQEPALHLTAPTTSTTTTIPTTTVKEYCNGDRNWRYFNDSCYYVSDEKVSWHESNARCRGMGAYLTSLHGNDEINAIFRGHRLNNYLVAIGLTRLGLKNWEWVDGSPVDFAHWYKNEPNNFDESERCAFMFTTTRYGEYVKGTWNDQHCGTLGGFVCKKPETQTATTQNPAIITFLDIGHCPAKWMKFGNKCYGLFTEHPLNWTEARDECRSKGPSLGADLVSIHSLKEQAFITSMLWDLEENIWIGLSDRFWNDHFWWSNNLRVQYTNWLLDEPNLTGTKSFDDAHDRCAADGANLVSINSAYEQAFVEALLVFENKPVWIGLVELELSENDGSLADEFYWQDDWHVTYTKWAKGMPTPTSGDGMRCVSINPLTGTWSVTECYFTQSFICKKAKYLPPTFPPVTYNCSDEQIRYEDKCFQLVDEKQKSWSDAHLSCLQRGMMLASFHSYDEGAAIMRVLYNYGKAGNIWLGLIRNIKGGYYWIDQTPVDYTYWSRDEPDNKFDDESCVEMVWGDNGRWNDVNCENLINYLCEKPAEVIVTTPGTTTTTPVTTTTTPGTTTTTPGTTTTTPGTTTTTPETTTTTPGTTTTTPGTTTTTPGTTTKPTDRVPAISIKPASPITTSRRSSQADRQTPQARRQAAPANDGPLIAGVTIPIVLILLGLVAFIILRWRRSHKATFNTEARFQLNENGGSLRFANKLYDEESSAQTSTDLRAAAGSDSHVP
ncbi:macrophage mannose receptor 1-like [Watersipora subatra]|uniref:macrophage mannose receptor 1-like n=1 Tax=Watersipora subatra TaxID=2589382 RepID=UPI00355AD76A